jgi:4-aminobutyrate aminotransferase-like enzyme
MADTIQKYKDYVMTGFLKSVAPIVIHRASGATVTGVHGRGYLDCFAGISVVKADHSNLQVSAAAKAQMDKLVHCSACFRKGTLIGVGGVSGNVVRFQPPLVITRREIDQALAIFTEASQEVVQPAHAIA